MNKVSYCLCCDCNRNMEKEYSVKNSRSLKFKDKPIEDMFGNSLDDTNDEVKLPLNSREIKISPGSIVIEQNGFPSDKYEKIKILGEGSYGTVFKVKNKFSGEFQALKVLGKNYLSSNNISDMEREINILKNLDHPNILKIYEYYHDDFYFYIITELCSEGNLLEKLEEMSSKCFNEKVVKVLMYEIISAVYYLHCCKVIHGDLKLENIMIDSIQTKSKISFKSSILAHLENSSKEKNRKIPKNIGELFNKNFGIKLIDFGSSKIFKKKKFSDLIGTLVYNAPEVIENNYDEKSDIWSLGIIMYILITGKMPFDGHSEQEIMKKILKGEVDYTLPAFSKVSNECMNILKKLLTYDSKLRPSAKDILDSHYFFLESESLDEEEEKEILSNIQHYTLKSKFMQCVLTYLTHNFVKKQEILNLRMMFKQIDSDSDGRISKAELMQKYKKCGLFLSDDDLQTVISSLDIDNSGYIEYEEFIKAAIDKKTILTEKNLKLAFQLFDKDNNGRISLEEITNILGKNLPDLVNHEILVEINKKHNEELTFEEFMVLMQSLNT
jgi:calcium-dependent protein kinase